MRRLITFICGLIILALPIGAVAQDAHEGHSHADDPTESIPVEEHHDHDGEDHERNDHDTRVEHDGHNEETIVLSPEVLAEFGVELSEAGPGVIRSEITVPGEIAVNGDRLAHIVPRFTGVIREVRKNVGDHVRKGDVLAIVESNEALNTYEVKSLLDGVVIEKDATIGEVHSTGMTAFLIADLDTVWVNLSIYQMHLSSVKLGQHVAITVGHGDATQYGTISYISPIVDVHTRTATARVILDNRSGEWRPGLLIEGRITTAIHEVDLVLPRTALQRINGLDVIFVQTHEGFVPQPVTIGRTNHTSFEVLRGLHEGDVYVSKGGFILKSEMQKGSFGHGHAH